MHGNHRREHKAISKGARLERGATWRDGRLDRERDPPLRKRDKNARRKPAGEDRPCPRRVAEDARRPQDRKREGLSGSTAPARRRVRTRSRHVRRRPLDRPESKERPENRRGDRRMGRDPSPLDNGRDHPGGIQRLEEEVLREEKPSSLV